MTSFWFWLIIIGIFLILAAAVLAGGQQEVDGWAWGFFIAGIIVAILGIILAVVEWNRPCKKSKIEVTSTPTIDEVPTVSNIPSTSLTDVSVSEPVSSIFTPIGTPTRSKINIPQAQRGFTSTNMSLSSLAQN